MVVSHLSSRAVGSQLDDACEQVGCYRLRCYLEKRSILNQVFPKVCSWVNSKSRELLRNMGPQTLR